MQLHKRFLKQGFTLVELLVTLFITSFITIVAFNFFVSQLGVNERSEAYQRQRKNWDRTTKFIESEVSLSEAIITDPSKIDIPSTCTALFNTAGVSFLFALDIRADFYPSIYALASSSLDSQGSSVSGWFGEKSLWRCGPSFDERGQYLSVIDETATAPLPQRLIDGLSSDGFSVSTDPTETTGRLITFTLSMEQDRGENKVPLRYSDTFSANTRNNPLYTEPNALGLCDFAGGSLPKFTPNEGDTTFNAEDRGITSVTDGRDILICGVGKVTSITGSSFDDLIEAGGTSSTSLIGCNGSDVIEGTETIDTIYGDQFSDDCPTNDAIVDGNDILIGNGNNSQSTTEIEILDGGNGYNQYVPGRGNFQIDGGDNLDVVYFTENFANGGTANYVLSQSCDRTSCTVTDNTVPASPKTLSLTGVEILIFRDQRKDIPVSSQ